MAAACAGLAAACAGLAAVLFCYDGARAGGETRILSLYGVNTKESLTVTYMRDGRHDPEALRKLNFFLRDWRKDAVTRMDVETIDLMWELHADLGSRAPIHIISGYRSSATNSMLKRIGRNVARQSQHIRGKAIDLYFPDVSTEKVRNSALVRRIGGVGFYPRSGAKGFVHIDSGSIRHWPRISEAKMASIFQSYSKTVGARLGNGQAVMVARNEPAPAPVLEADEEAGAPVIEAKAEVKVGPPKPRPRPIEVLMLAAAQIQIEPAAAPVPKVNFAERSSPVEDRLGAVVAAETLLDIQQTNTAAKGSFAELLRFGEAPGTPLIRPLAASAAEMAEDILLWPTRLIRRDGAPQPFGDGVGPIPVEQTPEALQVADLPAAHTQDLVERRTLSIEPELSTASTGKGDFLVVNRTLKGDLVLTAPPRRRVGAPEISEGASDKLSRTFESLLDSRN